MKFPTNILLDFSKKQINKSSQYWIFSYLTSLSNFINFSNYTHTHYRFILKKNTLWSNPIIKDKNLFTVKHSYFNAFNLITKNNKTSILKLYKPRPKVKHKLREPNNRGSNTYDYLISEKNLYNKKILKRLLKNFNFNSNASFFKSNLLWSLFDLNFLKKEKIYTKLKYSRVPQYDIVSGGSAALFAGFLGFLICEKFGFELVDSGDFYFIFMYLVFVFFFIRLLIKIINAEKSSWLFFSFKWFVSFYLTIFSLFIKFFVSLKKTIFNNFIR